MVTLIICLYLHNFYFLRRRTMRKLFFAAFIVAIGSAIGALPTMAQASRPAMSIAGRLLGVNIDGSDKQVQILDLLTCNSWLDISSGAPVPRIELETCTRSITDKDGELRLGWLKKTNQDSSYFLLRKIGYDERRMAISVKDTAAISVIMSRSSTNLPEVLVETKPYVRLTPNMSAFEERYKNRNGGHFARSEDLRKVEARGITHLGGALQSLGIVFNRRVKKGGPKCSQPVVYVDGMMRTGGPPLGAESSNYEAAEYYEGPATVPIQYGGTGAACGVLLLWSRERL